MDRRAAWTLVVVGLTACNDDITLTIAGDRPVPTAVDAICVGIGDVDAGGAAFGRRYALTGELAQLPQTLRVDPAGTSAAWAWVRGDRGGVPVVRTGRSIDFARDVALVLDKCEVGSGGAPAEVGDPVGPANARLVVSNGIGGERVVALGATTAVIDARQGALVEEAAPALSGKVIDAIAADVDGDCDDDLVIVTDAGPPVIWLRSGSTFVAGNALGSATVAAIAAGDVDRDGDIDLITGVDGSLRLWRNDGSGAYTEDDGSSLAAAGRVQSIRALALGDLDDDGNPDLVVGQAGDPLMAWLGEPSGTGSFVPADAVVSPVPLSVKRMQLVDIDGDFDPDLVVAVENAPLRVYVDRQGLLEDQTFVRFVDSVPTAEAIAVGGWDPGCEPDAIVAGATASESRRGEPGGALAIDGAAPPAGDVVMADLDHDGDLDAALATPEGVRWLAR